MRINLIKPQPIALTPAKARLITRLKGDGSIFVGGRRKTNYFLKYGSANLQELEQFTNDLKEVYNLEPKCELHRLGKKIDKFLNVVFVRSKLAFMDMQRYGPFYSRTWRVPKKIKGGSKNINGKENILAFKNFIGFRSQKRKQKLNELTSTL